VSNRSEETAGQAPETLGADAVAAWLRRHPEFLVDNPEVLTFLTPPEFDRGEGIVDMQRFMLDKLRGETTSLRRREKQLMSAAEGNAAGQAKIHQSVLAIIDAPDVQALNSVIRTELPGLLDLEAAALCIEENGALSLVGAAAIGRGGISNLMGSKRAVLLQARMAGESFIFGDAASRVKSVAYLRLRSSKSGPAMLLALGSGREDGFSPDQGTELISFLAAALEMRLRQCLARQG